MDGLVHKSKKLSWLLRFGAGEAGITMDAAGWCPIDEVLAYTNMSRPELDEVVRTNNKQRLQQHNDQIRACQGHGLNNMPVTREALEHSWTVYPSDTPIWHGTQVQAALSIATQGILAGQRTHVHLAATPESKVGKRTGVTVLLEVSPSRLRARGTELYESPNGVILVRTVPRSCITGLTCLSKRAQKNAPTLRAAFKLS